MDSSEGTAPYLEDFRSETVDGLRQELDARGACLRDLVFAEAQEGV
ncbi:hypothetical protein [Streptomyces hydrogenans]